MAEKNTRPLSVTSSGSRITSLDSLKGISGEPKQRSSQGLTRKKLSSHNSSLGRLGRASSTTNSFDTFQRRNHRLLSENRTEYGSFRSQDVLRPRSSRVDSERTDMSSMSLFLNKGVNGPARGSLISQKPLGLIEENIGTLPSRKTKASKPSIGDYMIGDSIGQGSYSRVHVCKKKGSIILQAVKILEISFLRKEKKTHLIQNERTVLIKMNHPLIVGLQSAFKDKKHLYFVLDFCENGDLSQLIKYWVRENRRNNMEFALDLFTARFYFGETCLAVQALHENGYVHRDLKPENILIAGSGHIKLSDFGTVKDENLKPQQKEGTKSVPSKRIQNDFVGTADYVSPEMLEDKEVSVGADYWAFGVLLFHLILGRAPFRGETDHQTFNNILAHEKPRKESKVSMSTKETTSTKLTDDFSAADPISLDLKPSFLGCSLPQEEFALLEEAEELIAKLLRRNPASRLGAANDKTPKHPDFNPQSNGPEKLLEHLFFQGVNFRGLPRGEAPKIPYKNEVAEPAYDGNNRDWMMKGDATDLVAEFNAAKLNTSLAGLGSVNLEDPEVIEEGTTSVFSPKKFSRDSNASGTSSGRKGRRLTFNAVKFKSLRRSMSQNMKNLGNLIPRKPERLRRKTNLMGVTKRGFKRFPTLDSGSSMGSSLRNRHLSGGTVTSKGSGGHLKGIPTSALEREIMGQSARKKTIRVDADYNFIRTSQRLKQGTSVSRGAELLGEGGAKDAIAKELNANESVLLYGIVKKRKGLFSHSRVLILTSFPRFLYFAPKTMDLKGEISFSSDRKFVVDKKGECFAISADGREYVFSDEKSKVKRWEKMYNEQDKLLREQAMV
eukprot:snap_masked-scaffold_1-processed-gene-32.27-mRNA-1 protein AED:0.24 eAED:0.30 QI:0/-1/0/1/-1/1/1/0/837